MGAPRKTQARKEFRAGSKPVTGVKDSIQQSTDNDASSRFSGSAATCSAIDRNGVSNADGIGQTNDNASVSLKRQPRNSVAGPWVNASKAVNRAEAKRPKAGHPGAASDVQSDPWGKKLLRKISGKQKRKSLHAVQEADKAHSDAVDAQRDEELKAEEQYQEKIAKRPIEHVIILMKRRCAAVPGEQQPKKVMDVSLGNMTLSKSPKTSPAAVKSLATWSTPAEIDRDIVRYAVREDQWIHVDIYFCTKDNAAAKVVWKQNGSPANFKPKPGEHAAGILWSHSRFVELLPLYYSENKFSMSIGALANFPQTHCNWPEMHDNAVPLKHVRNIMLDCRDATGTCNWHDVKRVLTHFERLESVILDVRPKISPMLVEPETIIPAGVEIAEQLANINVKTILIGDRNSDNLADAYFGIVESMTKGLPVAQPDWSENGPF